MTVVICGGDGTISLLLEDMRQKRIEINDLDFVMLPYGTGNDLAQQTGWGATPDDSEVEDFMSVLKLTLL
jgi:diacylglycerol kinase family enzyme